MQITTLLFTLFIVSSFSSTEAWWGWGGFGFRPWGLGGLGYGYPYGGFGYPYGFGYGLYGRSTEVNKESRVECIISPVKNVMNCNE